MRNAQQHRASGARNMWIQYNGRQYREALIERGVSALKNYLTLPLVAKGREAVYNQEAYIYLFGFIDQEYPDVMKQIENDELEIDRYDLEDFDYADRVAEALPDQVLEDFASYIMGAVHGGFDSDWLLPSFVFLEFKRIVTNQWLVHFTGNASSIAKEGFKRGACDYTQLGLTTWADPDEPEGEFFFCEGGYNFAFTLDALLKERRLWTYGNGREAVMFKASGVECWHKGDRQYQTIFSGNTARDIIPIFRAHAAKHTWTKRDDSPNPVTVSSCRTGKVLREGPDLPTVIAWVTNHYDQYRKQLVCGR